MTGHATKAVRAHTAPAGTGGTHRLGVGAELPALLRDMGADPVAVLAAAGAPADALQDPESRMSYALAGRILARSAQATRCPHLGVLLGLRGGIHTLGLVGQLMATAPTMQEALLDLTVNQIRYVDGAVSYLALQGDTGLWGYVLQAPPAEGLAQILDTAMGLAVAILRQLTGQRGEEMRMSYAVPADPAAYRQVFGMPVFFDAEQTSLAMPAALLAAPVVTADAARRRVLQRQVADYWARAQPPVAEQTRRTLAALVTTGHPTLERVAAALGLGPRTLNRRLQAEGTSFRAVLGQARHDVACQLLGATRLPVTQIGLALGYATPPGFVRAFRRAAGLPPSEWRRARMQAAA